MRGPSGPSTMSDSACPVRIASSACSASSNRSRSSSASVTRRSTFACRVSGRLSATGALYPEIRPEATIRIIWPSSFGRPQLQPEQHPFDSREIADEPSQRRRKHADERGRGDDLLVLGQGGHLVDVDDLQHVTALQLLFTKRSYPLDGARRGRRGAGDVKTQEELSRQGARRLPRARSRSAVRAPRRGLFLAAHAHASWPSIGRMSSPTSTRSSFERSPMIFFIGCGSLRTSVGTARIWSPAASRGFLSRSITSIEYCPLRCSSQRRSRLRIAATHLAVCPAM